MTDQDLSGGTSPKRSRLLLALENTINFIANKIMPTAIDFIKSAAISLIILLIIGFSLPKAPQVNSIVVNLYNHPWNLVALLLVAPFYASMMAHYPSYFNIDKTHRTWYRSKRWPFFMSTIFYKYRSDYKSSERGVIEGYVNVMLRAIGVLFYGALLYMLLFTSTVNFDWSFSPEWFAIICVSCGIALLLYLRVIKNNWLKDNYKYFYSGLPHFYDGDFTPAPEEKESVKEHIEKVESPNETVAAPRPRTLMDIRIWIKLYCVLFLITVLAHGILFYWLFFCADCNYTQNIAILSLICIILQMIRFVWYRTFRSVFRFTFFNPNSEATLNAFYVLRVFNIEPLPEEKLVTEANIDEDRQQILDFFTKEDTEGNKVNDFVQESWLFKFFRWLRFGVNSNNISFLQFTALVGYINLAFLIIINVNSQIVLDLNINAVIIILSYIFFFYGLIIVLTKNFIYYKHSREKFAISKRLRYYGFLIIAVIVIFTFNRLGRVFSNELYTLVPIDNKAETEITLSSYVKDLNKDSTATRYYIGAYGGGMKANAWTMTVLNELYGQDEKFFDETVGISGVSGGTMGMVNMAGVLKVAPNDSVKRNKIITAISTENILSMDLTHILGRDLFGHLYVPYLNLSGTDRSTKAMEQYARIIHKNWGEANTTNEFENVLKKSFRGYWRELYMQRNSSFPILIANTTNVIGNQGMAVSVRTDSPNERSLLYQGADDILDIGDKTLTYYDAASTSNRFPVISPAAKIESLGHYNDGGIYENSGLLSVYKLFRAINCFEGIENPKDLKQRNVFIGIVNDKNQYIKKKVLDFLGKSVRVSRINKNTEINAIINSIAATEMMPIFVKTELDRIAQNKNFEHQTIYLPHRFTVKDIYRVFGQELALDDITLDELSGMFSKCVVENDLEIKRLVTSNCELGENRPIIEPPMSRVMSKEAYQYMRQMLGHPLTKTTIKNILKK